MCNWADQGNTARSWRSLSIVLGLFLMPVESTMLDENAFAPADGSLDVSDAARQPRPFSRKLQELLEAAQHG